jgi:hypothetical protein
MPVSSSMRGIFGSLTAHQHPARRCQPLGQVGAVKVVGTQTDQTFGNLLSGRAEKQHGQALRGAPVGLGFLAEIVRWPLSNKRIEL